MSDTLGDCDTSRMNDPTLSEFERGRLSRIAAVQRRLERFEQEDQAAAQLPARRKRRVTGPSIVVSIRFDPAEVAALEQQAAAIGIKPTVLARNLVRIGLSGRNDGALAQAVDQLDAAVADVRALVH